MNLAEKIDEMLDDAKAKAAIINDSLENEELTQTEMNIKSQELYEVWDGVLNDLFICHGLSSFPALRLRYSAAYPFVSVGKWFAPGAVPAAVKS